MHILIALFLFSELETELKWYSVDCWSLQNVYCLQLSAVVFDTGKLHYSLLLLWEQLPPSTLTWPLVFQLYKLEAFYSCRGVHTTQNTHTDNIHTRIHYIVLTSFFLSSPLSNVLVEQLFTLTVLCWNVQVSNTYHWTCWESAYIWLHTLSCFHHSHAMDQHMICDCCSISADITCSCSCSWSSSSTTSDTWRLHCSRHNPTHTCHLNWLLSCLMIGFNHNHWLDACVQFSAVVC